MFDRCISMMANMTYHAMPMSATPVHVSKTFFQPSQHALSINTAAAGGNASLMSIG